jgi:flagellar motor component MotA
MIVGFIFIGIGVFVAIPAVGGFGVVWTLVAVVITCVNAYNAFSEHGIANEVVDFETTRSDPFQESALSRESTEERLRELASLRQKGFLREEEYEEQRKRILDEL